jgi:hypothetical protein
MGKMFRSFTRSNSTAEEAYDFGRASASGPKETGTNQQTADADE